MYTVHEAASVSHQTLSALKLPLIMRLEHAKLAVLFAAALNRSEHPYLFVAGELMWTAFDRSVTAHMRGADQDALFAAGFVDNGRERAIELAGELGFKDDAKLKQGFGYLDTLPLLLGDQQRRARAPRAEIDVSSLDALSQPERIKKLIDALDDVRARQWGQPGGVSLGEDRIVKALIDIGEPAVDALIDRLRTRRSAHRARYTSGVISRGIARCSAYTRRPTPPWRRSWSSRSSQWRAPATA